MANDEVGTVVPESKLLERGGDDTLLLQIRSDRRLGHEWDDWDGAPLPDSGIFLARERLFFELTLGLIVVCTALAGIAVWFMGPRLSAIWNPLDTYLARAVAAGSLISILWVGAVAMVIRTNRNWIPARFAERGVIPWLMPHLERIAVRLGLSRDRAGNAMVRVFNRLAIARHGAGMGPEELLILIPRCLAKEAMRQAMDVSTRYGVPIFVAARGRYARQMIAMRRPKGIVAVACERDLVSGMHDVAGRLPVLGTTLKLSDGPCRNTEFEIGELEDQVRSMLGLGRLDIVNL